MNFMFEWQELLLCRHADDAVFDDFPKFSDHFLKISEDFLKLFQRPDALSEHFPNINKHFPKIAEDDRWRSDDVSIIHQQI